MSLLGGGVRELGGDHQRPVGAGAEALVDQVVGLPGHRVGGIVARVGEAEPHAERRRGERQQHRGGSDRRDPRPALDPACPARGGRVRAAVALVEVAAEERQPPLVHARPEVGEQRWQEGDRGRRDDEHRDRGRERHPVHVREAGQAETEDRDHHGRAGDDHAAPGGGHRLDDRVVGVLAGVQRAAEAGEDEQRVVDPDPDPDQAGDGRGPVGDVDEVREQEDQPARGDAEPDQRDRQRQAGGDDRAEGDQEDDRGAEEAEALGARRALSLVDHVTAELDREAVAAVLLGGGDQLLALLLLHLPAGDGHRQGRGRDRAVVGDADRRVVGDVLDLRGRGEEVVEPLLDGRVLNPRLVLPDDVDLLPGVAAELLLGEVAGSLGLRARRVVVGVVLAGDGGADADRRDERDDPGDDDATTASVGQVCERGEAAGHTKLLRRAGGDARTSART